MKLITAPDQTLILKKRFEAHEIVFVAGGISNCSDWQAEFIQKFEDEGNYLTMINPRRHDFDITNPNMSAEQIEWEYKRIQESHIMTFWFPHETLCPITLYELGAAAHSNKTLFVGCHPDYQRKFDVVKQLSLVRPEIQVVFSLDELAGQLKYYLSEY
jgi:hypothetical protein